MQCGLNAYFHAHARVANIATIAILQLLSWFSFQDYCHSGFSTSHSCAAFGVLILLATTLIDPASQNDWWKG